MRYFYYKLILFLCISFAFNANLWADDDSISRSDTIFTNQYILSASFSEPQKALRILDQAEREGRMPQYQIDLLRSGVYQNGPGLYRIAALYSEKVYQSDSIRQHPEELLHLLDLMIEQYNVIGDNEKSIRYAIEGAELAKKLQNKSVEANMHLYIGINKRDLGLKSEASPYIDEAIKIQEQVAEKATTYSEIDNLLYSYGMKITYALEDSAYQTAIALLPAYERQMKRLEAIPDTPEGLRDMRYASEYAAFACIFYQNGEPEKAERFYRRYLETNYSTTSDGEPIRIEYLLTAGRYKEALYYIERERQNCIAQEDTVSYNYIHYVLEYKARAEAALLNHEAAAATYKQMLQITDSLNARDKKSVSLELATLYETKEKDLMILKQQSKIRENHVVMGLIAGILLLAIGFIVWIVRDLRITLRKNKAMAHQINSLISCETELSQAKKRVQTLSSLLTAQKNNSNDEEPLSVQDKDMDDSDLFNQIDDYIKGKQLFLQPDIDRETLMRLFHINKTRFVRLIQNGANTSFNNYINDLRLEYSISLMRNCPHYTIEATATESGFNSSRSYYRLFRDKYGMTPFEYKKATE